MAGDATGGLAVAAAQRVATAQTGSVRPDPEKALAGLDEVIEAALKQQRIPGASVGVVVGDRVVLLKGYGVRDVETGAPMTPDTRQQIASVTKQFTVAALGTLVRQGKLEWDKPVRDYVPEFRMGDDAATLRATARDLVTHRVGMPRHDLVWFGAEESRAALFGKLKHLASSRDMRSEFQYNNLMYMAAGVLGARVAGDGKGDWEGLVRRSIFEPLGMSRSGFSLAELKSEPDAAKGYQLDQKRNVVPHEFQGAESIGPAGSIISTARDMTAYARMMLGGGALEGKRILQEQDVQAMMSPVVPIGVAALPEMGFRSYGMGLFVYTYRGVEIAEHGGNLPGAAAMMLFAPKERVAVVVLTNRSASRLRDGLPFEILDRLLGLPSARMIERMAERETKELDGEEAAESQGASDRRAGTRPAHELGEYAGRYEHPGYGVVEVTAETGGLVLKVRKFSARLEHWHYEVFQTPRDRAAELDAVRVQFITDLQGEVSAVQIPLEAALEPIAFKKLPPQGMLERAFLETLTGVYDLAGVDVTVGVREDGVPQMTRLGRSTELVPVRGRLFRAKGATGTSVEFLVGADGKVDRLAVHSGSSVIAPRLRAAGAPRADGK